MGGILVLQAGDYLKYLYIRVPRFLNLKSFCYGTAAEGVTREPTWTRCKITFVPHLSSCKSR